MKDIALQIIPGFLAHPVYTVIIKTAILALCNADNAHGNHGVTSEDEMVIKFSLN